MYGLPPHLPKDSLHLYRPDAPAILPMSDPMLRIISVLGLDLGQSQDPSAGCMIERAVRRSDFQGPLPAKWQRDRCTKLARWPLGTDYEKVILDSLNARPDVIVVEYNGVGRPVVDWMRKEASKMQYAGKIVPVLSVGANARPMLKKEARGSHYVIPKIDLVSAITIVLQKKTVFMSKEHAKILGEELGNFQLRYKKETGNETMGNAPGAGNHDDVVICFALCVWYLGRFLRTKDLAIHW